MATVAEVVSLSKVKDEVNDDVVALLRESLDRAEKGEVIAVALVEVRKAGTVATAHCKNNCYHALNSGASRLAFQLNSQND